MSSSAGAAIIVEDLGKEFTLGERLPYATLRDGIAAGVHRLRRRTPAPKADRLWALREVSFELPRGEVLGLIGRNGAGKSTLLKILARITPPTCGRAVLDGRVGSMLEVGTGFHPELTGAENIYLNGAILGMTRREIAAKFDQIAEFAELAPFLTTPVKRYSSGMYVRLAFAVAAHLEPEILLVDEVLAVGDVAFQKKCLGVMGDVARAGRTIVFVSHNLAAVQQLTRTALWLEHGRVAAHGPTREVTERYLRSLQDAATTVWDLRAAARPFSNLRREVELVRIELEGRTTPLVDADEVIAVRIRVRGRVGVAHFRFGITVQQLDGTPVGTMFAPAPCGIAAGEEIEMRVRLAQLRLAPGSYVCAVSAGVGDHRSERREFDVVRDVLQVQVLAPGSERGTAGEWHPAWGATRFPAAAVERVDGSPAP